MIESFAYASNASIDRLADRLRSAKRVMVTTHSKPDGDALGSVLTIVRACQALGIPAEGWLVGPFEPNLLSLAAPTPLVTVDPARPRAPEGEADLVVIVDTGAWTQLEVLAPWLRPRVERAIGFDHHARGDRVAAERLVDVSAGSCTAILARLVDALRIPFTFGANERGRGSIAEAIYLGLATDTGWFRFQNARAAEMALAARLLDENVDKDHVIEVVEQSYRHERLKIEAKALSSVRFIPLADGSGEIALMRLEHADFKSTGATLEETSGVVNLPMVVKSVRATVLLVDIDGARVKASFRSKPKDDDGRFVDVNTLAAKFGGGGHVHAAGARFEATLDEAEKRVEAAIRAA